ncbi:piwi-like protein 1 [Convolutriloba macropyga]|uniref:piwi-like protein 1 n=1 Tax=Convolutriloba macropyga TaxID=536237 RepID=UPI003F51C54C
MLSRTEKLKQRLAENASRVNTAAPAAAEVSQGATSSVTPSEAGSDVKTGRAAGLRAKLKARKEAGVGPGTGSGSVTEHVAQADATSGTQGPSSTTSASAGPDGTRDSALGSSRYPEAEASSSKAVSSRKMDRSALGNSSTSGSQGNRPRTSPGGASTSKDNPTTSHSPASSGSPIPEMETLSLVPTVPPEEKMGRAGSNINVMVNYLKIETQANSFFQYSIEFRPNIDNLNLRKRMVRSQEELRCSNYDGGTTLYTIKSIGKTDYSYTLPRDNEVVKFRITPVRKIGPSDRQSCVLLNMMFNKLMRILNYKVEKKASYNTSRTIAIPQHKMEIWPGYVNTVTQVDGGLLLMCDVSHRVVRTQNVYDLMKEIERTTRGNFQRDLTTEICGQVVMTRYNKKTYRVDDIDWDMNPLKSFDRADGTSMTFIDYYEQNYDLRIADGRQPLILHRAKNKRNPDMPPQMIYLVPELCYMTGLSENVRNNYQIMKEISEYTKPTPVNRVAALEKFVQSIYADERAQQEMHNWGVDLARNPIMINARQIHADNYVVFARNRVSINRDVDFGRELSNQMCVGPVNLTNWILCHPRKEYEKCGSLFNHVRETLNRVRIRVEVPEQLELQNDRAYDYVNALRNRLNPDVQLVLTVFSSPKDETYNAVKTLLCKDMPVASQVVLAKTLNNPKKLNRIALNIGLQMVAKLGGQLWEVNLPRQVQRAMFIGIDVYHQAQGKSASVVGFVATRNPGASKFWSQSWQQNNREEIMTNNLRPAMMRAIEKFKNESGFLPDSVVIFRDGVGDHQMDIVKNSEIALMKRAFAEISPQYSPHFAVIVVQKRISTRIFSVDNRGGVGNAPPGTVVDHTVTKRGVRDFYLVSQSVRQGTVTPTRYVVLENTPGGVQERVALDVDTIQSLAFKLTFLYYNWPGSVRVPAPCQYAHKLAQLVGMNIGRPAHENLADKLFYL